MLKKILAAVAMLSAAAAFAAVDVNKATAADLDGIKGVGPTMSKRILEARKQGEFKDWADFMARTKGVKEKTAGKLSAEGLTVNGKGFDGAAPAPKAEKVAKTTAKASAAAADAPKAAKP